MYRGVVAPLALRVPQGEREEGWPEFSASQMAPARSWCLPAFGGRYSYHERLPNTPHRRSAASWGRSPVNDLCGNYT